MDKESEKLQPFSLRRYRQSYKINFQFSDKLETGGNSHLTVNSLDLQRNKDIPSLIFNF